MTRIIVDGKEAFLKEDLSFEYVRENPLFTDAEDYSMEISFPLKDCPQNVLIFGAVHVKGVDITTISYPCEILSGDFHRAGILTIVSVTDIDVKGQFLEGISAQNFHADLGSTYITDLDYSRYDGTSGGWGNYPEEGEYDTGRTAGWVEFPVYDTSKERLIEPVTQGDGFDYYSRHVYLWKLVDLVAAVSGWKVNQSVLKRLAMYMHVVVVNTRNFIYNDSGDRIRPLGLALPHWTIKEFYEQVGNFFGCLVDVDRDRHQITFKAFADVARSAARVNLDVLDDFEIEVNTKDEPQYRGARKFKLPSDANPKNINSCSFISADRRIPHQQLTKSAFLSILSGHASHSNNERTTGQRWLYELTDTGQLAAIIKTDDQVKKAWVLISGQYQEVDVDYPTILFQSAEILNQYGDMSGSEELKICPCPLEGPFVDFLYGYAATTPRMPIYRRKQVPSMAVPEYDPDDCYDTDVPEYGIDAIEALSAGERKEEDMYFDKLWVVLWTDQSDVAGGYNLWFTRKVEPLFERKTAEAWGYGWHTFKDENGNAIAGEYTFAFGTFQWNLSPTDTSLQTNTLLPQVDETKLYHYSFLSTDIPDPKAVFVIKGKEYVCSKLTARFNIRGMSELIEGEFYEVIG